MNYNQNIAYLLKKDLFLRMADIHWQDWGQKLGVDIQNLSSPLIVNRGEQLIHRWASYNGIPSDNAPLEMARRLDIALSMNQRLLFSEKASYDHLGAAPSPLMSALPVSPLESLNFQPKFFFPYVTPDGKNISGGMVYLGDNNGNSLRMPVTPWQIYSYSTYWDYLSWSTPFPLFNINKLFAYPEKFVFILPSEEDVVWFTTNVAWLDLNFTLTTWPGGLRETLYCTDWGLLASRKVVIIVSPSEDGARLANSLLEELEKAGASHIYFILPEKSPRVDDWKKQLVILRYILNNEACSRDEFWTFANHEFGLELGPKKEQALHLTEFLALPTSESIWMSPNLIRGGDRVMVYGVAKSGKTTWIVHEILCMAEAGHSVLYVDGEMGIADLQARLKAALGKEANIPNGFRILSSRALGRRLCLETPEDQGVVLQQAKDAEVVVLDNLHALFPSSLQAGPESCEKLNKMVDNLHLSGKTVILIHHSSRGGASFGSSVKELGLELQIKITRKGSELTITPEAARGLSPEQLVPHHFVIPTSSLCLEEGMSMKALPAAPAEEKEDDELNIAIRRELKADSFASCRAIAEKVGAGKTTVSERVKKIKGSN